MNLVEQLLNFFLFNELCFLYVLLVGDIIVRLGVIVNNLLAQFHYVTLFGPVRKLLVKFFLIVLALFKDLREECG